MSEAGQFVLNDDGTFAIRDDGTFALFDAGGECDECCEDSSSQCNTCGCAVSVLISGMTGNAAGFNGCHNLECGSNGWCGNPGLWECSDGCFYKKDFHIIGYSAEIGLFIPSVCEGDQPVTAHLECWLPSLLFYCGDGTFEYDCREGGFDGTTITLTPDAQCGTGPSTATLYESLCP